ncbi:hypothetical protein NDA16_000439 [Ustilago loliicola]|nr:hypothetical protein NDA16_000439 [Ustilago loliicola]
MLDTNASEALQMLLGSDALLPSSSKLDLSTPSPVLVAISNNYIDRCIQNFDSVAAECAADALLQNLEQLVVEETDLDLQTTFVAHLQTAGLAGPALTLLTRVMHAEISRKVRAVVDAIDLRPQDNVLPLESAARPVLQQWLDDEVKPRFAAIRDLCLQQDSHDKTARMNEDDSTDNSSSWQHRFDYQLDKALCLTRANQLFDLVAMYPDSSAALDDLRLSLQTADQRLSVAKTLSSSLQMRLLHPGAHTRDIIQMYVHLVRALREMDPTGVVLSRVVSPLRRYLRGRKDTVLVIVASMLGDDPDFTLLKDELERADQEEQEQEEQDTNKRRRRPRRSLQTSAPAQSGAKGSSKRSNKRRLPHSRRAAAVEGSDSEASSDEDWDDPNWVPKPAEAGSGYRMSTSKDIISMLTSIFDDRSGFIAALEKSMADQLVQVKGYKATKEYRNNMILKKRFGEKNMGKCDVMLGDEEYGKTFSQAKAMRKLHWLNHLGTVELDVELDSGESLTLECTLIQASTLEVISRRSNGPAAATGANVVTLTDVMEELNLQREKDGRDALEFWVQVGLLKPVAGLADASLVQSSLPSQEHAGAEGEEEGDDGESL